MFTLLIGLQPANPGDRVDNHKLDAWVAKVARVLVGRFEFSRRDPGIVVLYGIALQDLGKLKGLVYGVLDAGSLSPFSVGWLQIAGKPVIGKKYRDTYQGRDATIVYSVDEQVQGMSFLTMQVESARNLDALLHNFVFLADSFMNIMDSLRDQQLAKQFVEYDHNYPAALAKQNDASDSLQRLLGSAARLWKQAGENPRAENDSWAK